MSLIKKIKIENGKIIVEHDKQLLIIEEDDKLYFNKVLSENTPDTIYNIESIAENTNALLLLQKEIADKYPDNKVSFQIPWLINEIMEDIISGKIHLVKRFEPLFEKVFGKDDALCVKVSKENEIMFNTSLVDRVDVEELFGYYETLSEYNIAEEKVTMDKTLPFICVLSSIYLSLTDLSNVISFIKECENKLKIEKIKEERETQKLKKENETAKNGIPAAS